MSQYIAVQGCSLQINGVLPGSAIITSLPNLKAKAGGAGIYVGTVSVQLIGCSSGTYQQTAPVSGNFQLTAVKTKAGGNLVLLENDVTSTISVPMQNGVSPFDSQSFSATVKVSSAGQIKAKGV